MSALTTFDFEGREVRIQDRFGEPWFVGKDVCECLAIKNHRDVIARLDEDEMDYVGIPDAIGRERRTVIINEPGCFQLAFTSRSEAAKRFKRWLAHEVLPSLRRTGRYEMPGPVEVADDGDYEGDNLLDPDQERMWHSRIALYNRVWGRSAAQWAFERSPLPRPPQHVLRSGYAGWGGMPTDAVEEFLASCVAEVPGGSVEAARMYDAYSVFARENGFNPVSRTGFGIALHWTYRVAKVRRHVNGRRAWVYSDLGLLGGNV